MLTYFNSWSKQNLEIINIFDINAKYKVKPFNEEVYNGLDEIIKYWQNNPMKQLNQHPQIIECFPNKTDDKYFVEFTNMFEYNNKIKHTHGMILFKIKNNKIYELSEFYKSQIIELGIIGLTD